MKLYDCDLTTYAPRGIQDVLSITYQLLSAVEYIHGLGIIHSDIKRANILVKRGAIPLPVLCDFGISLRDNERVHIAKVQTVDYRAPEVNFEKLRSKYSTKIDIWSLGIVILEMLVGKHVMNYEYGCEDSTIYAAEFFGLHKLRLLTRGDRLSALKSLKSGTIVSAVMNFIGIGVDSMLYSNGFVAVIALSLHPNSAFRSEARTLKDIMRKIIKREFPEICEVTKSVKRIAATPMSIIAVDKPSIDEMVSITNIPIEIIGGCSVQCLQYAEYLYNTYITIRGAARHDIKLACVYIASATYCDSNVKHIVAVIDSEQLCTAIGKVIEIM